MDTGSLSILVVSLFTICALSVGLIGWKKKKDDSAQDFFVASRSLGFIALYFTYTATYHSASSFLGTGSFLYFHGISYWAVGPMTQALGGIFLYLIGSRVWLLGQKYNFMTPGDLLADFYQSPLLKVLTGVLLSIFIIPYIQLQLVGAGWITEFVTQEKVSYITGAFVLGLIVVVYVFLGGMRSVVWTDVFMGVVMFVAIILGCWLLIQSLFGGTSEVIDLLIESGDKQLMLPGNSDYFSVPMAFSWSVIMMLGLSVTAPHIIIRMFSASSVKILKWVAVLSPLYLIWVYMFYIWFGLGVSVTYTDIDYPDKILPMFLYQHTPVVFAALVCSGGLAAILSTANSQLHAVSALVTRDVYQSVDKNATDKRLILVGRVTVIVVFLLSFIAAIEKPTFLAQLAAIATSGMTQIFPMLMGALFWPRATTAGALSGFLVGSVSLVYLQISGINFLDMMPGIWALIINGSIFIVVSLLTKPMPSTQIERFHGYLDSDEAKQKLTLN